ncbi:MAG: YciI family protein, partial [Methylobacter sp.]
MLYAIISEDVADSLEKRMSVRPAHIKRLQELQDAGRLILAGPHPAVDSDNPGEAGF